VRSFLAIGCLLTILGATSAAAHSLQPGFLLLDEGSPGSWSVSWTAPPAEEQLVPFVESDCVSHRTAARWTLACESGQAPSAVRVRGISLDSTEVVVRLAPAEGSPRLGSITRDQDLFTLSGSPGEQLGGSPFVRWLTLGVEHILGGIDHLLFVLGLVLLITGGRQLVATITSFTLAHSITLGGASLGALSLPGPPVEATIAASILLLAVELTRDEATITRRKPWAVAFVFGLLHGFGFAGALSELGLPDQSIWMPLLSFNLGVELGQLAFVAAVVGPVILLRRAPRWLQLVPVYAIGGLAAAWMIQRIAGFWGLS
jgi:hydrogenase/urease accessory protein HupE